MIDHKRTQIKLVYYTRPEKNYVDMYGHAHYLDGNAHYVCNDGDKRFRVYRSFDKSGKTTWETVEDGQSRLTRYFENGKVVKEDVAVGLGKNEPFVAVWWDRGSPVGGYSMTDKAKSVDAKFDFFGGKLVFSDEKQKRNFNQEGTSNMTQEEAESCISQMISKADAKRQELISLSEKVPQKSSVLSRLIVGTKTFLKEQRDFLRS